MDISLKQASVFHPAAIGRLQTPKAKSPAAARILHMQIGQEHCSNSSEAGENVKRSADPSKLRLPLRGFSDMT